MSSPPNSSNSAATTLCSNSGSIRLLDLPLETLPQGQPPLSLLKGVGTKDNTDASSPLSVEQVDE